MGDQTINVYVSDNGYVMVETKNPNGFYAERNGHPVCRNRAYINSWDSVLVNLAISAANSGRKVSFYYDDAAKPVTIPGHENALPCKIFSLWIVN